MQLSVHDYIDNNFLNPTLFLSTYITNNNLLKAVKYFAHNYATGDLIDLGCGVKPYETLFENNVKKYIGVDFESTVKANYGEMTKPDVRIYI